MSSAPAVTPGAQPQSSLAAGMTPAVMVRAVKDAFVKLDPRKLVGNPVILATEVVAALAAILAAVAIGSGQPAAFAIQIALWLRATVLFANLAESVSEGRPDGG